MDNNFNWVTGEFEPIFTPYAGLFQDIKERQSFLDTPYSDKKAELKRVIDGHLQMALDEVEPYLDINAHERGDFEFRYAENIPKVCGKQVTWHEGAETHNEYVKKIDCRKQWCPICGGKGGTVHKARLHSLFSRISPDVYNIRQFVFTVPEILRKVFQDRERLADLFNMAKQTIEKFFGETVFDKNGHVKKYRLDKPVVAYLHAFGDKEPGVFKPHINVHILESKKEVLKLNESLLAAIKKYWLKKLRKYEASLEVVDVQYSFITKTGKIVHALKYMCRPWSEVDYINISDESLKRLLVLDLSGFQYLRYWGKLSNRTYKDEMDLTEINQELEPIVHEKLIFRGWTQFDFESYKDRLIEIDKGFYQVMKRGKGNVKEDTKEDAPLRSGASQVH